MKSLIFIICIILVIAINYIWFYRGLKYGMKYCLDKTYDIFMKAIYIRLKKR